MRATDPQKSYLSRLAEECFVKGLSRHVGYDMRAALRSMRKDEASTEISRLRQLLGKEQSELIERVKEKIKS